MEPRDITLVPSGGDVAGVPAPVTHADSARMAETVERRAHPDSLWALVHRMGAAAWQVMRGAPHQAHGPPVDPPFQCPLCAGTAARDLFAEPVPGQGTRRLVQCTACRLTFLHPTPRPEELGALYGVEYYGTENRKFGPVTESFVWAFRHARVRALRLVGVKTGTILDVGCGRGLFLRQLAATGYVPWGTELTPESAAGAQRFFPEQVRVGPLAACEFETGQFDAITAWQVFEHLHDPRAMLAECRRILRPGGVLILSLPNIASWQARWAGGEWFHLDLPRHLFHYTPATVTALLQDAGFVVERTSHYSLEQNPFGLLQSALQRLGAVRMGLYNLLRGPVHQSARRRIRRLPGYAAYLAAFPVAAAVEYLWSVLRSGATVTVLARRPLD